MSNEFPLISVVMPVYNAADFLPGALDSIQIQDYAPIEIIVVDDGSTDGSADVVAGRPGEIRYMVQENAGPAAARNRGIEAARGEIIAFLDADDRWPESKLPLQVGRLLAEPELDIVSGRIRYIDLPGADRSRLKQMEPEESVQHVHLGAALFRRRAFDKVGLFDESLRYSEDVDWFLRAREQDLRLVIIEEVTLYYRLHEENMTRGQSLKDLQLLAVLRKSLTRRRRQGGGDARDLRQFSDYSETKEGE